MWSDRLPEARRRGLVERLRPLLPVPRRGERSLAVPLPGAVPPERVAAELRGEPGFLWLDGGGGAGHLLAARPLAVLSARGGRAHVSGLVGPRESAAFRARGLDLLEATLALLDEAGAAGRGAVLAGYLGYELAWELEKLPPPPPDDLGLPDLYLALYPWVLRGDAAGDAWRLEGAGGWSGPGALAVDPLRDALGLLERAAARPPEEVPAGPLASGPVVSRPDRRGFEAAVARAVEHIAAGDIFQVNLCRRLETSLPRGAHWPLYLRLRSASPATHGAYLDLGRGRALLSISPETFLSVRHGVAVSRPIKGTRPRGEGRRRDEELARELLASEKDRAELTMIVDVARNDLGRASREGTVEVPAHAELLRLPTVLHTVSTVRGRLAPDVGPVDLLRAAFPPASITGAPKIRAMAIAAAAEERRRGPAMGALGWIGLGGAGEMELSVAIRTAAAARGKVVYHAGCGVVADSDPAAEFAETEAKARAFLTALGVEESEKSEEREIVEGGAAAEEAKIVWVKG